MSSSPQEMQTHITAIPKGPAQCWRCGARYCIVIFCCVNVLMLIFGGLWPALTGYSLHLHKEIVVIKTDYPIHIVSDKFLSVALDSSLIGKKWDKFEFRSEALQIMGSALSPCYLRLGGTAADRVIFDENAKSDSQTYPTYPMDGGSCSNKGELCAKNMTNITLTGEDFIAINRYAETCGMELLYDLNVLLRSESGWDDSNARELIDFAQKQNFKISWQLGNEPNAFHHVFDETVTAFQLGRDFEKLRRLLNEFPLYKGGTLVGPDITRPRLPEKDLDYLRDFLREVGPHLSAVTWHQYYLNGREAVVEDFLNVDTFNKFFEQIYLVRSAVQDMALSTPIWLGESGSAYGGGAPELSDRFLASFLWLDKLGVSASEKIDVVVRQTLYGGHYGLIAQDLQPNPDFWLSVVYKRLVGHTVLGASQLGTDKNKGAVRIYCHCTASTALNSGLGGVTVFALNLRDARVQISIQGIHNVSSVHRYILQGETGLQSRNVLLNGKRIELQENGALPHLKPQPMDLNSPIILRGHAIGFWVLHGAQVPACKK